jgi:N-methylhydantoinase B
MDAAASQIRIDPVKLEIIRTGLQSIPDLIEADLTRTAYSPLIYEYKDYAVGLVDADGRAIALATHGLPVFTTVMGVAVRDALQVYGRDRIEPGDVVLTNYAGTLGQHLNNVVMFTPIFDADQRLLAFMAVTVHWIDIGGSYPGSCLGTDNTELIQEGLHLRSVKLFEKGELVEEVLRIIEYNTRLPEMLLGDLWAQHAGVLKGKLLFEQLLNRHGQDVLTSAIEEIWRHSEKAARAAIRSVPEGVYTASSFLDDDGIELGKRVPVDIKVRVENGDFIVDYSGIGAQLRGPFNSGVHGGAETCARIAFKYLFSPDEPLNEGGLLPVKVEIPPGRFLSATGTAPLGFYSTPLPTVVDTIIAALAPVLPKRAAGGHNAAFGVFGFAGQDPRTGQYYHFFDTGHGGWGGSRHGDGAGPLKTITHADTKDIPVETIEALYPLRVEAYGFRQDSAGPGRNRGGLGLRKTLKALHPVHLNLAFERFHCPPWGFEGGKAGASAWGEVETAGGERIVMHKVGRFPLQKGDCIHVLTGGGGGCGAPTEREPEAVLSDVVCGFVSRAQAEDAYGVVLTDDEEVDLAATRSKRAAINAAAN